LQQQLYRKKDSSTQNRSGTRQPLRNKNTLINQTKMQQNRLKAKGIFLDLDGTIVDSTGAYIEAAQTAFHILNLQPPKTSMLLEIPKRMEQHLTLDDITGGSTAKFLPIYLGAFRSITERKTQLLPNVSAALATLSQRSKLALITMRHVPNQVIQKELDYFGIARYFSHVVTGLDTTKPKPSPEALILCTEAFGVDMCDCLIAGDSVSDMRAGKAAGAKTVALLSGLYRREELELEQPDLVLSGITELPRHVE
jgi:phosphoglycolate phosphatase